MLELERIEQYNTLDINEDSLKSKKTEAKMKNFSAHYQKPEATAEEQKLKRQARVSGIPVGTGGTRVSPAHRVSVPFLTK